ncbi:MAG TPA: hypothetical protein VG734_08800 [Lacunisphaera sp.]|nr:hypothetical protein [Lacunisphaera sp.]
MNTATDNVQFAFATPDDDGDVRQLLRETPMRGTVSVGFTHEPDYFAGTGLAGASDRTVLARVGDRLVATGRCVTRPAWVNGEVRPVAYLGELRLAAGAQGRWDILRRGYEFFGEAYANEPADFCYTSIVADNTRARRLFERGARGLPRYEFIGELVTLLLPACSETDTTGLQTVSGAEVSGEALATFLNVAARTRQLAAHWTPEMLSKLAAHGLPPEDLVVLRDQEKIVACAGIWNQQSFRQIRIEGYSRPLAAARPIHNLLAPLLAQPLLPRAGSVLNHAFLTPFACHPDRADAATALLKAARHTAASRGLDTVALGGFPDDPWLHRLPGRRYLSRLYRVDWPGVRPAVAMLDGRPCLPDIGLL